MKYRLIEFLAYLNISQKKFEENCGLSNGFADKVGDSIREVNLQKILKVYPELNINWLKTGEGKMIKKQQVGDVSNGSGTQAVVNENNGHINLTNGETATIMEQYLSRLKERDEQVSALINQNSKLIEQIDKLIDKLK